MNGDNPLAEMIITDALGRWPETAAVFHKHNMSCVGCAVAPFFTIADAASVYRIPLEPFLEELEQAIGQVRTDLQSG